MSVAYQFFDLRYQAHWHPKGTYPFPWFLYRHYHHLSSQLRLFSPLFSDKHQRKIRANTILWQAWQWLRCRFHPTCLWSRWQELGRMSNAETLPIACLYVESWNFSFVPGTLTTSQKSGYSKEYWNMSSNNWSNLACLAFAFCILSSLLARKLTVIIWVLPWRNLITPSFCAAKPTLISTFADVCVDFLPLECHEWLPLIFFRGGLKPLWRSSSHCS